MSNEKIEKIGSDLVLHTIKNPNEAFTKKFINSPINGIKEFKYSPKEPDLPNINCEVIKAGKSNLDLLEKLKGKNWCFSDHNEEMACINMLNEVNYYTLAYYGRNESNKNFSAIKSIYYFDDYLRIWLMEVTTDIEFLLRTALINTIAVDEKKKFPQHLDIWTNRFMFQVKCLIKRTNNMKKTIIVC